ncbi:asparaginase [Croceimicrobium hydrocarbonivorans]|uniref:Asparaginase n=1 Tax=Croceimicrobium hydrocarbonivorans TaxID=2761580 RepID=A0A7H0VIH7_9FLAO|nr:asparaginase [Croceimicrobium hydrocarbonivorans]QNR25525.1 asparaginase [Croceimicrobium hydrocarbonivorans]
MSTNRRRILILYTGGTIGMILKSDGAYHPFSFENLQSFIPELRDFPAQLEADSFDEVLDSSNMTPAHWLRIARRIEADYLNYDAFLILHGSDTMAYTSAALSFMLQNLAKPVILTGSQLPVGIPRSDARENILSSLEIAIATNEEGGPMVPEVAVYFEYNLYRGNRLQKVSSQDFEAFRSPNYPLLAEAGVQIKYNRNSIMPASIGRFQILEELDPRVAILHCFPGMQAELAVPLIQNPNNKAIILRTFGSGNAPGHPWLLEALADVIQKAVPVINVSQCSAGEVEMSKYEAGRKFQEIGLISAGDMVLEAALTKAMVLLAKGLQGKDFEQAYLENICGELSV